MTKLTITILSVNDIKKSKKFFPGNSLDVAFE